MKHRKKKHHTKRRHSKRSGMGAIDMQNILGVVIGAVGSKLLDKVIPDTINRKIVAGGKVAVGVLLPNLVKSGKMKDMLSGVGSGFIAVGSMELVSEFGILSGLGIDDQPLEISLNGDQDILAGDDLSVVQGAESVLAGDDLSVVQGMDED